MSEAGIAISDISMELPEAKANPELLQRCKRICDDFRLSVAAKKGNLEGIRRLLDNGHDPNQESEDLFGLPIARDTHACNLWLPAES